MNLQNNRQIKIPGKAIILMAFLYLVVPIEVFFVTWLRFYVGIPAALLLAVALYIVMKSTYAKEKEVIAVDLKQMILIGIFFALWVWTTGIGNFFVSAYDHPWRIAIFRDLIDFDWPVIYPETGNGFVYYFFYWLVPALIGKIGGWTVGNIALVLWTYIGISLVFFLLIRACCGKSKTRVYGLIAVILFGWSGLNTVGSAVTQILNINLYPVQLNGGLGWLDLLYNGYSFNFFYRSNHETLVETFNQATPLWIATLLTIDNRERIQNFAFIGLCLLPFAPLPFLGLVVIMIALFIIRCKKNWTDKVSGIKAVTGEVLSKQNLLAAITIFPIIALFFACNVTTQSGEGGGLMLLPLELFDKTRVIGILLFWLLEFGIIAALIFSRYKKNPLYYAVIGSLLVMPLFEFGKRGGRDFCMNATLPAIFILMVFTIRYVYEYIWNQPLRAKNLAIICVLLISMLSPIQDIAGKIDQIGDQKRFPIVNDTIYSFSERYIEEGSVLAMENFLVPNPKETMFFKYLAK